MKHEDNKASAGFYIARELTSRADETVRTLFNGCSPKALDHWCVAALGGYGRQDLCPCSDLDILFLIEKKMPQAEIESALKEMLYPLWDAGFNASYSVRTIRQAVQDTREDFFFRTSVIDARYVCGSETVFERFSQSVNSSRFIRNTSRFVSDLIFHTRKRHEKYGDSVYFLEPHIKDGHGGLRDYQSILWLIKVFGNSADALPEPLVSASDLSELNHSADLMIRTRFLLHKITGRKTDQMHLEYQEMLAHDLGYRTIPDHPAVEEFLRDFHTGALTIRSVFDGLLQFLQRPKGLLSRIYRRTHNESLRLSPGSHAFPEPEDLQKDPSLILQAFLQSMAKGLSLTPLVRSQIKSFLKTDTALKKNPEACRIFLKILQCPDAENTLAGMLETGVIEGLIPEFRIIRGKTIFDVYHTYTIDLHSIHTVCELNKMEKTETEAWGRVIDKDVLFFSAFLHDIGKGYGRPHALLGSEAIEPIAVRFAFDKAQREAIAFLIRNHLIMAEIASRRDLSEEKVINDLAQKVGNASRLSMLYLLTIADSKATGPNAWNDWKASLLWELFIRTLNILEKGILKSRKNAMKLEEKWHELVSLSDAGEGSLFKGRLWALPQAYVHTSDLDDIKKHLCLSSELIEKDDIKVEIVHGKNHVMLTVITRDRPGLFSLLTGILSVNRIEIISAKIFTWYDGTVVDTFKVLPPWEDYTEWHTIRSRFEEYLSGKNDIESRLVRTKALKTDDPVPVRSAGEVTLAVDNDTSDFFTIIDVRAHKRIGLIHDISRAISFSGLAIHRAFLSRNSDLFSSVFYVVGAEGEKMIDQSRIQEVLTNIRDAAETPLFPASPGKENRVYSREKKEDA